MSEVQYTTGVCNIGEAEINQRRRIGYIGLGLTLVFLIGYVAMIYLIRLPPLFGVIVFVPAEILTVGFLQARKKFCAAYGLTRRQNLSSKVGLTIKIENSLAQKKDRNKALVIIFQSIILASAITILTLFLGFILYLRIY
ncbi:MAG: hypothetical protein ACW97Z_15655 [Candidatus Hodarchaeales archaeon]